MAKKRGLSFYEKEKKISKGLIRDIIEIIVGTIIVIFMAFVIMYFVGTGTTVIGNSMEPALYNGQEILINKFSYKLSSPKREDVIVFLPNGNENTHYYVKRVIGLPGETIQIKEGRIYINGHLYEEDDSYDEIADAGIAESEIVLGSTEYFVLGDNRNSSEDSRSGNIGPIDRKVIIGKAWFHMAYGSEGIGYVN